MLTDRLFDAAMAVWPDLARDAGLTDDGWTHEVLSRRSDARVQRIVILMRRDEDAIVLKHEAAPVRPEEFAAAMSAHLGAFEAFGDRDGLKIPQLLAFDVERQSCLMSYAAGRSLAKWLDGADLGEQCRVLERAGAWVCAFHGAQLGEHRVFQPKFTVRYLNQIMGEVRDGTRKVARKDRFLAAAAAFVDMSPAFEGQQSVTAKTHGDLHLRNLMLDAHGTVTGLDFTDGNVAPVGHDLARLLVDYATLFAPAGSVPEREVLPLAALGAFFQGYTLVGQDDPSVQCLMRMRILVDWWAIPAKRQDRSAAQQRRFRGLMRLAGTVFDV